MKKTRWSLLTVACVLAGCSRPLIDGTDRSVYSLIEDRQLVALGETHDANLGPESGAVARTADMYSLTPNPLPAGVPEEFNRPAPPPADAPAPGEPPAAPPAAPEADQEQTEDIYTPDERARVQLFSLRDALAYAMRHARDLQGAKEDLYIAALELSLERHLWTPQFVASAASNYSDFPDDVDPERSVRTISDLAVSQRLPFGGDVTARVIQTLTHEMSDHVTKGESGQVILSANLPLLRGAGRIAYESRYTAERELIYAVRRFENFRRAFLVEVAADFLALQQSRASIVNTYKSYLNRGQDYERAAFIDQMGRSRTILDAPRAKANLRLAEAALVSAKERYASAIDRFKIRLAMPMDALLDVVDQDKDEYSQAVDSLLSGVTEADAISVALRYRLDLLNSLDFADDARRGVANAKNRLLPDLDLTGSTTFDSDPEQLRSANLREERSTWQGGVVFRVDDRRTEQSAYRAALIALRASERDTEELADTVRADVRRAIRRIAQQENLKAIQSANVQESEFRVEAAREQFRLGKTENRDVVEAENNLLFAQNDLVQAVADYRIAILEFRRDTGTLRVADDGQWATPEAPPAGNAPPGNDG